MALPFLREEEPPADSRNIPNHPRPYKRHWIKWFAAGLLILLVAIGVGIVIAARHAEPFLRALIVERLSDRFHARVELDSFHISVAHGLWAQGKGLRIWPPAQVEGMAVAAPNAAPLISLAEFRFHAPLHYPNARPVRIDRIVLRGLDIVVPPRPHFTHAPEPPSQPTSPTGANLIQFQIGSVICTDAKLTLVPGNPAKLPLIFDIQSINLTHITQNGAMNFDAVLSNPRPKGLISSQGTLGPWMITDPGTTPVAGSYRFEHADLSVFRGIAGILDSTGNYGGTLRELIVDGQTDTPDFSLDHFGTPEPLHTDFHARVDGTNGDTWLEPVNAILGHSHFVARGKVVQITTRASKDGPLLHAGHQIVLDLHIDNGEMADFLRLTSRNGDPLLTGNLDLRTNLELHPGLAPVHQRLRLKGRFLLQDAHFTSSKVQDRIGKLSLRSQGKPKEAKSDSPPDVGSTMASDFTMAAGKIHLPDLVYTIPGAEIDLHGDYGVDQGALNFRGTARMSATVSQMVGGWKGVLLKPVDRFFKKDGAGTKVGVHIEGSRDDPQFGLDL